MSYISKICFLPFEMGSHKSRSKCCLSFWQYFMIFTNAQIPYKNEFQKNFANEASRNIDLSISKSKYTTDGLYSEIMNIELEKCIFNRESVFRHNKIQY